MSASNGPARVVVNLVGDPVHGRLAEARWVEQPYIGGGWRTLYELAFAAAVCGYEVELRGWLHRPTFDRLAVRAGVRPRVDLPARMPEATDLVVVPDGWRNPLDYLRVVLSPARLALAVLGPIGMSGWPFVGPGWELPDPLTMDLDAVGRPEHFAAMDALGFALLTNSPGVAAAAHAAGVQCTFVGTARPLPESESVSTGVKEVDVAALMDNRWGPLAEGVLSELDGACSIDRIERVANDELLARLARARVLVWPSRIEGHASIPWETRSVSCVPVALGSNRFAVGLSDECGAVVVDTVAELAPAVRRLLADPKRLKGLAERARRTAPFEVDWKSVRRAGARVPRERARTQPRTRRIRWHGGRAARVAGREGGRRTHAVGGEARRGARRGPAADRCRRTTPGAAGGGARATGRPEGRRRGVLHHTPPHGPLEDVPPRATLAGRPAPRPLPVSSSPCNPME